MAAIRVLCLVLIIWMKSTIIESREGPPVITAQSDHEIYYTSSTTTVSLTCTADGSLPLTFVWDSDGHVIQNTTVYNDVSNLTLDTNDWIDGSYVCIVGNKYGRTLSDEIEVEELMIFPITTNHVLYKYPPMNMPFILHCDQPISINEMATEVHWVKVIETTGQKQRVQYNERITYDTDGNLYFLYVDPSDRGDYQCNVSFPLTNEYFLGPTHNLEPMDVGVSTIPMSLWRSDRHPFALQGQDLTLRCIYGGRPIPQMKWQKVLDDGTSMPMSTQDVHDYGRSLTLHNISYGHSGEYQCVLDTDADYMWFDVAVESSPSWLVQPRPIMALPSNTGSFFYFICTAISLPVPVITWSINTEDTSHFLHTDGSLVVLSVNQTQRGDAVRSVLSVQSSVSFSLKCTSENDHGFISTYSYLYLTGNITYPSTSLPNITYTPSPRTLAPSTPKPWTTVPYTSSPRTLSPSTPKPWTTVPYTSSPRTLSPSTPKPWTTVPYTSSPRTLSPSTSKPSTTVPYTPSPRTLSPSTPKPSTTASASTPGPSTSTFRPTSTTTSTPPSSSSQAPIPERLNVALIGGAAGGGIVVFVVIIAVICCISSKRRQNMDSKPDIGRAYGNRAYSGVDIDVKGKHSNITHPKGNKENGEVYTGLSMEREKQKANVYDQLGIKKPTGKDTACNKEETEYCYISDADLIAAQRQSNISVSKPGISTIHQQVPRESEGVSNYNHKPVAPKDESHMYMYVRSNAKPLPKTPAANDKLKGKMDRFASGKYSAIDNPVYSGDVPQLSLPNQGAVLPYEEPVSTKMSHSNLEGVQTVPDNGYFKLEPSEKK